MAVSGGADSVCLLHVLRELAPRWDLHLRVLHLNHRLRGAESDADAAFVRCLAEQFGYPFIAQEAELSQTPGNLEEAAREARLAFFSAQIASGAVDCVATGHTRSDQAETVLFRFLRGAGTAGLAGIRPATLDGLVRPLIHVDRAEVEQFLRERSIPWREDQSNRNLEFARNRIRHGLLPQLSREWNPGLVDALSQMADWALAEEAYWEMELSRLASRHFQQRNGRVIVKTECLREVPLAAARRLVRRAMETVRGDLRGVDFSHVNGVLDLAAGTEGHGRIMTPGLDIMRSFEWLRFSRPEVVERDYCLTVTIPGVFRPPGEMPSIALELIENKNDTKSFDSVYNKEMACVDWDRLSGSLSLRNWRPGDQYQPLGSASQQKVKTLFQDFRIPLWERRHWPVLIAGESIVWARRFGPASRFAPGPETRKLLQIREIGIEPGQGGV